MQIDSIAAHDFEVVGVGSVSDFVGLSYPFSLKLIPSRHEHPNVKRNLGVLASEGDILAFLDDDTAITSSWFDSVFTCPPDTVLTGPEMPMGDNFMQLVIYDVCCFLLSEGTKAHVNFKEGDVGWSDVPLCNLISTRKTLTPYLPLDERIPWDLDDFHLLLPMRGLVRFFNSPSLLIKHDRYPPHLVVWFKHKWKLRVRLGEKLIRNHDIYLRLPSAWLVLLAPYLLTVFLFFFPNTWVIPFVLAYFFFAILGSVKSACSRKSFSVPVVLSFICALGGLHFITIIAPQVGVFRSLVRGK